MHSTARETITAVTQLVVGSAHTPLAVHAAMTSANAKTHDATHVPTTDNNRVSREQKSDMKTADKTQATMIIQVAGFVML